MMRLIAGLTASSPVQVTLPSITSFIRKNNKIRKAGKVKSIWIFIAHRREHASSALPLPVCRRWSALTSPSATHQVTQQDHGYGLVYHAMCLFTHPAFAGYSISPTHGRMAQAEYIMVPGSAPRWFTRPKTVTHPGTNRTWRRVTTLIQTNVLLLSQTSPDGRHEMQFKIAFIRMMLTFDRLTSKSHFAWD